MITERDEVVGLNVVGLRRRGLPRQTVEELKRAFRAVNVSVGNMRDSPRLHSRAANTRAAKPGGSSSSSGKAGEVSCVRAAALPRASRPAIDATERYLNMALSGLDATIADALIGIDTVWGGDVMNPSGMGRFIADCWFSDEPLPRAYTHPAAAALRANGGVGAEKPDAASLSAYLAEVDVKGAIQLLLASAQEIGGLRGAHLEGSASAAR